MLRLFQPARSRRFLLSLGLLFVLSLATVLPMCHALFRCGCTIAHGERDCNTHVRGGPHCPWCEGGAKAFLPGYTVAMIAAALALAAAQRRWDRSLWPALLCGCAAYLLITLLAALITAKLMHYPIWLGWPIAACGLAIPPPPTPPTQSKPAPAQPHHSPATRRHSAPDSSPSDRS